MTDVDSSHFRALCGHFATGVVVVTAIDPTGRPIGMTANSFASVSLVPPLISLNVEHRAEFHATIAVTDRFTVNVLSHDQEALSRRFAGTPAPDRLEGVGYRTTDGGRIALDGTLATIECDLFDRHAVGDHTIVIGRVVGGTTREGRPLLYFRGGYRALEG